MSERTYGGRGLQELREMEAEATPGPWTVREPWAGFSGFEHPVGTVMHTATAGCPLPWENHALIAAARNALPELLAHIDELTRERDEARAQAKLEAQAGRAYADEQEHRCETFARGAIGDEILLALEDGQISRRKAAESILQALGRAVPDFVRAKQSYPDGEILADSLREARAQAARLRAAAERIRHWHDTHNGGMVVSGAHVMALWDVLAETPAEALEAVRAEGRDA